MSEYSPDCVSIHSTLGVIQKAKHKVNLAAWEKETAKWCAEQVGRIKKAYETHKSKPQMAQACQFKLGMSKSSHDLMVTNLSNKINCVTQNLILSEM